MTRLRGHFAMTLICAGDVARLRSRTRSTPITADGTLLVSVREVPPEPDPGGDGHALPPHRARRRPAGHRLGGHPGRWPQAGGNITDLTTRLTGDLYVLVAEVDLPAGVDESALAERLAATGARSRRRRDPAPAGHRRAVSLLGLDRADLGDRAASCPVRTSAPSASCRNRRTRSTQPTGGGAAGRRPGRDDASGAGLRGARRAAGRRRATRVLPRRIGAPEDADPRTERSCCATRRSSTGEPGRSGREGCLSVPDLTGDVHAGGSADRRRDAAGLGREGLRSRPMRSRPGPYSTRWTTAPDCCSSTGSPAHTLSIPAAYTCKNRPRLIRMPE